MGQKCHSAKGECSWIVLVVDNDGGSCSVSCVAADSRMHGTEDVLELGIFFFSFFLKDVELGIELSLCLS